MSVTIQEASARGNDPSVRHIVSISGGKDSAALAIYIKRQYPGIRAIEQKSAKLL